VTILSSHCIPSCMPCKADMSILSLCLCNSIELILCSALTLRILAVDASPVTQRKKCSLIVPCANSCGATNFFSVA
jgi:hypothetical protein